MKRISFFAALALITALFSVPWMLALTAGETYTVKVYRVNSDATTTLVESAVAVADGDGKVSFSFNHVPTNDEANFVVFEMIRQDGTVVKKSFVPAPPPDGTNELGVNDMSTSQTNCILAAGEVTHTDDPIVVAYLLVMVQTDGFTEDLAHDMGVVGNCALLGPDGWVNYLTNNGVTSAQLNALRAKMIYNDAPGSKDLRAFTSKFKSAVDNGSDDDMYEAGGYMAQIFVDAAMAAGIDPALILGAHDVAGDAINADPAVAAVWNGLPAAIGSSINQSMSAFGMRIKTGVLIRLYTHALETLNASGAQVTQFQTAATAFMANGKLIDRQYGDFFNNPQAYATAHSTDVQTVQDAINAQYNVIWTQFQDDIAADNAMINDLKTTVQAAFGGPALPLDFGTYRMFDSSTVNWPVTMVAIWNWVAGIHAAGGSLTYDRSDMDADIPVPNNMNWLNMGSGNRTDFSNGGNCGDRCIMNQIQEDVNIAEFTRNSIWQGGQPTQAQERAAKALYASQLAIIKSKIGGTKNGAGTAISTEEKEALIRLFLHPEY